MPMKKRLSSSIGTIIVLCAIIIISLQKYQPDKEVITTFIYEWLNDDSRAETEYKKILETGSDNQSLSQPLQKYFITEAAFQSFLKTFYYLPVKILQQYDSYNLIDINITKESNSYFVKVDLELIKFKWIIKSLPILPSQKEKKFNTNKRLKDKKQIGYNNP